MSKSRHVSETPATQFLRRHGVTFGEHPYDYVEHGGTGESARQLGVPEHEVVKTLVMQDDRAQPLMVLMHGDKQVSTKNLARGIGAKSGEPHVSPLGFTRDGDRWVVVGSNSGYAHDPAWVANIRADPHVGIEVGTEAFAALARITSGDERQRLWDAHKAAKPTASDNRPAVSRRAAR